MRNRVHHSEKRFTCRRHGSQVDESRNSTHLTHDLGSCRAGRVRKRGRGVFGEMRTDSAPRPEDKDGLTAADRFLMQYSSDITRPDNTEMVGKYAMLSKKAQVRRAERETFSVNAIM